MNDDTYWLHESEIIQPDVYLYMCVSLMVYTFLNNIQRKQHKSAESTSGKIEKYLPKVKKTCKKM